MGYVAMGAQALGGIMGAAGSISGGYANAAADRYQAQVANNNAVLSAQQADVAQQQGTVRAQNYFQEGSQRMGAARSAFGANGVDVNSGSAVADQASIARTTALNTNAVSYDADAQAVGYRNQAANYDTQAGVDRASASNAIRAGYLGAAGTLIGSAAGVASKWDSFRNVLPPSGGSDTIEGVTPTGTSGFGMASNSWSAAMLPPVG